MSAALEGHRPVVPMPRWSNIIRCARAVVAILVLAFAAAATGIWGAAPGFGVALFTSSATLIVFVYYFVALSHSPDLYNRWAVLVLESVGTLLWLVCLALLAGWTAHHKGGPPSGYGFWHAPFGPSAIGLQSAPKSNRKSGIAFAGTAAGLSGVEFALFLVTLVIFSRSLHRQRETEAGRVAPVATTAPAAPTAAATEQKDTTASHPNSVPVVV